MEFIETQKFNSPWFWTFLIGVALICLGPLFYGFIKQVLLGQPWGGRPASNMGLSLLLLGITFLFAGLFWLFYYSNLTTRVNTDGVHFRYYPFHRTERSISWEDIKDHQVETYHPIREFWGWGIRYNGNATAYTVSGNQGLRLHLTSGRILLIGTQRAEALKKAMEQFSP